MNCSVCQKEAKAHIYHCGKCGIYVHDKCWRKHVITAHKERK